MARILLIDADVIAFKAAASVERATNWGDGYWTWHADENEAKNAFDTMLDEWMAKLETSEYKLCLTDSEGNFRKTILPTYKGNRANVKRPLVLKPIREWLINERKAYLRPHLEGDDVMGILATWSGLKGEKIVVSIDKDMKSIPGLYCRDLESEVVVVSENDADYWHYTQTLTGDTTDGYSGCPKVGPKRAEEILMGVAPPWGTHDEAWRAIVKAYEKAGLDEHEALVQARVARILRASDYDFKNKRPILWEPQR